MEVIDQFLCYLLEAITLCDEISLAVEFEHSGNATLTLCCDETIRRCATFTLRNALQAFDTNDLDGFIKIAT
jgi:hypothetical protein